MTLIESQICRRGLLLIMGLILPALLTAPAWAQDHTPQTPDSQQMQRRLDALENEIRELKQQINTQQTKAQQTNKPAELPPANRQPSEGNVPSPSDQETKQLEQVSIRRTIDRPTTFETQQSAPTVNVVTQETRAAEEEVELPKEKKGTFDIYGFIMLDSGYNFGQIDPDWFDVMRPTKLPAFENEFAPSGNVFFSVRQTRFGVKTSNPTSLGDLKTWFEFELFGTGVDAGQTTFRLRQAYGELGKFGAGQTWSPFMDIDVFPNSIEYWGPNGMVFFRNVQFRWMPIKGDSRLTFAAEKPGASADQGTYSGRIELQGVKPEFTLPDLSMEGRLARKWGYIEGAAIFRKISWEDLNKTPTRDLGDTVYGWGINVSSNLKFTKKDTGRFQFVYGHGIENYMNDAPVDVGIKNNFSNPRKPIVGVPLPVLGVVAFVDHTWSERFSSTIGYSFENISNSDAQLPSAFHQGDYALTNLLYYPWKNVMMGGEFQFGRRVNFNDGWNYNDYKIQFSARYNFSKTLVY